VPRRLGVLLVLRTDDDEDRAFALAGDIGAESVLVLPRAERLLVDRLAGIAAAAPGGRVVGVVPGRGGAGATTLAAALARTAVRGPAPPPTMLVDADPLGGGIDLVLGAEDLPGLRWPELAAAGGALGPTDLRTALPVVDRVTLLSWHRGPPTELPVDAMAAVLQSGRRGHSLVVVDLPRYPDPVARVVLAAADLVLLVVPADLRSLAAAGAVAARLVDLTSDLRVVVRGPAPGRLTERQVADFLGLRPAGWLDSEPSVVGALEHGVPPPRSARGPLARLCRDLLDDLDHVARPAA
jgi:secretion/DNA translocation related CpaE-like protein